MDKDGGGMEQNEIGLVQQAPRSLGTYLLCIGLNIARDLLISTPGEIPSVTNSSVRYLPNFKIHFYGTLKDRYLEETSEDNSQKVRTMQYVLSRSE